MKGIFDLPEGYSEIKRVDLQKNKKMMVLINVFGLLIGLVLFLLGVWIVPLSFEIGPDNLLLTLAQLFGTLLAMILYVVAHEWVHGIFIKKYSGRKAKYGFTGPFAYAGSDAFFNKREYVVIALAPVVVFGALFLLLNLLLPSSWFWSIYFLQIVNVSGAVGDFYITGLMGTLPADVLTTDKGVTMLIYSKTK